MAELHPALAKAKAQTALQFLSAFNGEDFGFMREDKPGPHDRRHLAIALDYIQELGAMVLNLADRVPPTYGPDNPPRLRKPGESIEEYRAALDSEKGQAMDTQEFCTEMQRLEDDRDPVGAQDRKDAKRYRWLREWRSLVGLPCPTPPWVVRCELDPLPTAKGCHGAALDAAIDAAMLKTPND